AHVALEKLRKADPTTALKLLIGSEFLVRDEADAPLFKLVLLACHREGYGQLCQFITDLRRASSTKGEYRLRWSQIRPELLSGCLLIWLPERRAPEAQLLPQARWLLRHFGGRAWIGVTLLRELSDERWLHRLQQWSADTALPLLACGDVHMHVRSRKALADVMTANCLNQRLADCGHALHVNAERHLRSRLRLAQIYPSALLQETLQLAQRCNFSLADLRYEYPSEVVPAGETPIAYLRRLCWEGMGKRWPGGADPRWVVQAEHELALIEELGYEHYFLTVADIVAYARSKDILCQGRGSAANSVVCFCLGITSIKPRNAHLLFERFISRERNEPPDIDVDFEHERREEVIQYLYERYGRDRAALTATVICYRARSALRDVGRALGLDEALVERLSREHGSWASEILPEADLQALMQTLQQEFGPALQERQLRQLIDLSRQLMGMPRHLSQHVGGFVLTQGPLSRLVPIENASMPDRTVIEWDKDDLDALGLLKVDVLALGMLSALKKAFVMIERLRGRPIALALIPDDCEATYDMICAADTVGTFQIESRAQMSMLPRLQPRNFYDLVIEVAIVRPGPIQGGMVHPYLENRRKHPDDIVYPRPELKAALERTCGIPIFQEQVMQVAMIAAGFSAGRADELRRAMAAWKRPGDLTVFYEEIMQGMRKNGYQDEFAEAIFRQIQGFASYGFPESHAASFALLTYASCWVKCHEPAVFLCALLNAQPLGFYAPAQLVQDARRHHVEVLAADVSHSEVLSSLEALKAPTHPAASAGHERAQPAVRLGLHLISGLSAASLQRIAQARAAAPFSSTQDLALRAGLDQREMQLLAAADALRSLSGHRRQQVWQASAHHTLPPLLRHAASEEAPLALPAAPQGEEVLWDYASLGLSLRAHPLQLLRPQLARRGLQSAAELADWPDGRSARACGLVTVRQRPQTAKGTLFISLEDESGSVQVIIWPSLYERHRRTLREAKLLAVHGRWQQQNGVCHLLGQRFEDLSPLLGRLATVSRDFH
ncbi:MAG: error-prone DNA polymerase, partial [Paucibacter sp.]|nr:error-prone DNA polymerase [Roseateles sp.]